MNLQCPNCQKMLGVPEQYAGQLMKCPMCQNTFTVPGLPQGPGPAAVPPTSPLAPPPPAPGTMKHQVPGYGQDMNAIQSAPPPPVGGVEPMGGQHTGADEPQAYSGSQPQERLAPGDGIQFTITITPALLRIIVPAAMTLVLVL